MLYFVNIVKINEFLTLDKKNMQKKKISYINLDGSERTRFFALLDQTGDSRISFISYFDKYSRIFVGACEQLSKLKPELPEIRGPDDICCITKKSCIIVAYPKNIQFLGNQSL